MLTSPTLQLFYEGGGKIEHKESGGIWIMMETHKMGNVLLNIL